MDKATGISEPTVQLKPGFDYRDIPAGFMSVLEFRQLFPVTPACAEWAKRILAKYPPMTAKDL